MKKMMLRTLTCFLGLLLPFTPGLAENANMPGLGVLDAFIPEVQFSPEDGDEPFPNISPQVPPSFEMAQATRPAQPRRIRVVYPNGGEQWEKGKTYIIRWTSTGNIPEVRILIRWAIGQGAWIAVADRAPNTGEYSFKVPEDLKQEGSGFLVVVMTPDGLVSDASDVRFSVVAAAKPAPTAEVKPEPRAEAKAEPRAAPTAAAASAATAVGVALPKLQDGKTPGMMEMEKGKFLQVRQFEIIDAKGYTEPELARIQTGLDQERLSAGQTRLEKRLGELAYRHSLSRVLIPLLYLRLEEEALKPATLVPSSGRTGGKPPAQIEVNPHLQQRLQVYRQMNPALKRRYFHPRYVDLTPGQAIDRLQLGKDILQAIRPNYENEIREMVRKGLAPGRPKFRWDSSKLPQTKKIQGAPGQRLLPKAGALQIKKSDFDALLTRLGGNLSHAQYAQVQEWAKAQGLIASPAEVSKIHRYLAGKAGLSALEIPDINQDRVVRNYYEYHVALDTFLAPDFNEKYDEPYWQVVASVPQYDSNDPQLMYLLSEGDLYNVEGWVTADYDVHSKDTHGFRLRDRDLLYANTYNTAATLSLSLWEDDWSKDSVVSGSKDAVRQLGQMVRREVQEAISAVIRQAIFAAMTSAVPGAGDALKALISEAQMGGFDPIAFLKALDAAFTEIDISWVLMVLIYGGGIEDMWAIIEASFTACPEVTVALIAIQVAGPIVIDLFKGNFEEAFKELVTLPISIFKFILGIFTDLKEFFEAIMAMIDPDDFIQTRTLSIQGARDDLYQDGDWGQFPRDYAGLAVKDADSYYEKHGYGPTDENNSMNKDGIFWQPVLTFQNSDTRYHAYLNVQRTLSGGRETLGYSVKAKSDRFRVTKEYTAKSSRQGKIRVLVSALNSADKVPLVYIRNLGQHPQVTATNIGAPNPREFSVDSFPGEKYEIQIFTFDALGDLYGYLTLEEKERREPVYMLLSQSKDDSVVSQKDFLADLLPLKAFGKSAPEMEKYFRTVSGLADPTALSFESIAHPGYYLRHQNFRLKLQKKTEERLFLEDATFWKRELPSCERGVGAGGSSSAGRHAQQQQKLTEETKIPYPIDRTGFALESFNYPNYFIYADGNHLTIKENREECKKKDFRKKAYLNAKLGWFVPPEETASTASSGSAAPHSGGGGGGGSAGQSGPHTQTHER